MDTNDNRRIFEAGFDRAYALLSKLRAPVADERAAFAAIAKRRAAEVAAMNIADGHGRFLNAQGHQQAISALDFCVAQFSALPGSLAGGNWRDEFSRRVYEDLAAADNQDVPLEEYPARILGVLDALASAPVADESPMAKMAEALREKARQEQQAYQDRRNQATEWGPMPEGTEADHPIPSAPVAYVAGDEASRYLEWAKDRSAWEMPVGTPVYYSALESAPVAGEAESQCANCGKPASQAKHCISEYPEEGEWFCSEECEHQHGFWIARKLPIRDTGTRQKRHA